MRGQRTIEELPSPMSQTDARRRARELNDESPSIIYIAAPVPLGCWGGEETGWDVFPAPPPQ